MWRVNMKKLSIIFGILFFCSQIVFANQMEIKLDIKQDEKPVEIVGADIYANIEGKLTEITVSPHECP